MLVLCRVFLDKINLGVDGNQGVGGTVSQAAIATRTAKFAKMVKVEMQRAPANFAREEGMARGDVAAAGAHNVCGSVETRVVQLEQEGLFRRIVGFL